MGSILNMVKSLDSFGVPVGLNYKGDSSFKTMPGALLSFVLLGFLLFFLGQSLLELVEFKNPQITEVSPNLFR